MACPATWTYCPGQLTREEVRALTPEALVEADQAGRLDQHFGRAPQPLAEGQLTRADIAHMTPHQIDDARQRGQFDQLMQGDAA